VNLDEDVLGAVLGGRLAAQGAKGYVQDGPVMEFDQLPEGVVVTGEAGRNELALLNFSRRCDRLA
jgi:hypothetical protein